MVAAGAFSAHIGVGDDDNQANASIQAGAAANQSLNRTDILDGGPDNDVMFGLNGNDVMDDGPGDSVRVGANRAASS